MCFFQELYFGYPLYDRDATIIHHFAFFENPSSFVYPLFKAGLIFSIPLLKKLVERIRSEKITSDFFIDASHELALFIWDNGKGVRMTSKKFLCTEWSKECAVYGIDNNFSCVSFFYEFLNNFSIQLYTVKIKFYLFNF